MLVSIGMISIMSRRKIYQMSDLLRIVPEQPTSHCRQMHGKENPKLILKDNTSNTYTMAINKSFVFCYKSLDSTGSNVPGTPCLVMKALMSGDRMATLDKNAEFPVNAFQDDLWLEGRGDSNDTEPARTLSPQR